MQNSQIIKAGCFIILLITIMLLPVNTFSAAQQANNWLDEPVTIRFQNEPLSKVLEKVSQQTGIAILYDQELANEKVTGNYKDVKASDAITRLFSNKNKSIQVSKDKRVIIVKTFGAKNFIWAGSTSPKNNNLLSADEITLEEIRALQIKQYREFKEQISDDSEVLEGGMTRSEARNFVQQQNDQFEESLKNDKEVIAGDKTRAELRNFVQQQNDQFEESLKNDKEVIAGDKRRAELREFVQKQNTAFTDSLSDNSQVIEGDLIRTELRDLVQKGIMDDNK